MFNQVRIKMYTQIQRGEPSVSSVLNSWPLLSMLSIIWLITCVALCIYNNTLHLAGPRQDHNCTHRLPTIVGANDGQKTFRNTLS